MPRITANAVGDHNLRSVYDEIQRWMNEKLKTNELVWMEKENKS